MKQIKFAIAFAAAAQMSTSQVAMAAGLAKQNNRIEISDLHLNYLSEDHSFKDLYDQNSASMSDENRALIGDWIKDFGYEKIPALVSERSKSDTGAEVLTLTGTKFGKTYTFVMSSDKPEIVQINGHKVSMNTLQNPTATLEAVLSDEETAAPTEAFLSTEHFLSLSPQDKVIYLQHVRRTIEAAEKVQKFSEPAPVQTPKIKRFSFIELLLAPNKAWAEFIPEIGSSCIAAGNSGTYKFRSGGQSRSCFPEYNELTQGLVSQCGAVAKPMICNPLVYGLNQTGGPFCLSSAGATAINATGDCNSLSPLDKKNPEEDYKRILTSYTVAKAGKTTQQISACFTDTKVPEGSPCIGYFESHIKDFKAFTDSAVKECTDKISNYEALPDQVDACKNLTERNLALQKYTEERLAGAVIPVGKQGNKKITAAAVKPTEKKDKGGFWFLLIGAGLLALGLAKKAKAATPILPVFSTPIKPDCEYGDTACLATGGGGNRAPASIPGSASPWTPSRGAP